MRNDIDPDVVAGHIRAVAAERIIPRFRKLQAHEISAKKSPTDLVTVADLEAEIDLTRIFQDTLPGSLVVGEEAVFKGDAAVEILRTRSEPIWVIDPVDGTNNFAHGLPVFASMVALVKENETIAAWIYDIPGNRMAVAQKGAGTSIDGKPVKLAARGKGLERMEGFLNARFLPKALRPHLDEATPRMKGVSNKMCCGQEYLAMLDGGADFALYGRVKPWDHLPGSLLVSEAGGYVRKWDGTAYQPSDDMGGLLAATDERAWQDVQALLLRDYIAENFPTP